MYRIQKTHFFVLFYTFVFSLYAQQQIDSLEAKQDFLIFERILKKAHPSLYEYTPKDSVDHIFETVKSSLSSSTTDIELYKKMLMITHAIKDGHLQLFPFKIKKAEQQHFPLIFKIIDAQFYTATDDFGIPIGSKINTIDTIKAIDILKSLKKYVPSDGNNMTKKYRDIETNFGRYYAYEYGIKKEFVINYESPVGIEETITIPAETYTKVKHRLSKRNSLYDNSKNTPQFHQHNRNTKPYVYYKEELSTAVLTVHTFRGDIRAFKSSLLQIFKKLNNKRIKNLIVDVRKNNGGYRYNAVSLYSFLAQKPFKQITSRQTVSLAIPEKKYIIRAFSKKDQFLKNRFYNHPTYDGWKLNFDDLQTIMVPDKGRFTGKIYVLVGGGTFSTGSIFALNAKNDPNITLIGEECGGGYRFSNEELPVYYELPNSKINLVLHMEKSNFYTKDKTIPKGRGVPPDKYILPTKENLIQGIDPELDYVFRLIKGRPKNE